MPTHTKNWTQLQRDRFQASGAVDYVVDVVNGDETKPDKVRLEACFKVLNKMIPDLKAIEHSGDVDHQITISWKS